MFVIICAYFFQNAEVFEWLAEGVDAEYPFPNDNRKRQLYSTDNVLQCGKHTLNFVMSLVVPIVRW